MLRRRRRHSGTTYAGWRSRAAVVLTGSLALVFVAGFLLAPWLESVGVSWGGWLRVFYAPLCHQMPERSIALHGEPMAVCARCAGLYLGGVLGLFAAAAWVVGGPRRPRPALLAWAFAPTVIDALLPWLGLPGLFNEARLLVSIPAGFVAGVFLALGVAELVTPEDSVKATGSSNALLTSLATEDTSGGGSQ